MKINIKKTLLLANLLMIAILFPLKCMGSETVKIPIHADLTFLRQLLVSQIFTGVKRSVDLLQNNKCSEIVLSDPHLTIQNQHLSIKSQLNAKLAVKVLDECIAMLNWSGYVDVTAKPVIRPGNPKMIFFDVQEINLVNLENEVLTEGILWDKVKMYLHPVFNRFNLNLVPIIDQLEQFLLEFLSMQTEDQLGRMLNTLKLSNLQISSEGVGVDLLLQVESVLNSHVMDEPVLTEQEQMLWQQKWQSMDAVLTQTIKYYASITKQKALKETLFSILLDARYQLLGALQQQYKNDPVRHWFVSSWNRLIPVLQQVSRTQPQQMTFSLMTLISASDALLTLDKLGPTIGMDISINGLRRLARMVGNDSIINPLQYDQAIDPELLKLFGFKRIRESEDHSAIDFWPLSNAMAATGMSLAKWVPRSSNLDAYLVRVSKLLSQKSANLLKHADMNRVQGEVFRKLVLTVAWQESCWRQYSIKNTKIVPMHSTTGDTGIMQVNEKVWRGFFNLHKLRWDIAYNIEAGGNILLKYMEQYAIKKREHKYRGGVDNLARSTYSAYNGGPSQYSRYRKQNVAKADKKIDKLFYQKYLQVKQGHELAVAECYQLTETQINKSHKKNKLSKVGNQSAAVETQKKKWIHEQAWVKKQNKRYYTIQLGIFNSRTAAINFVQQKKMNGNYAVFQQMKDRQKMFTVIYGRYSTRLRAIKESKYFKRVKPWIHRFKDFNI